jgi:hypothetical protein
MARTKKEAGAAYLQKLLSLVPEAQRTAVAEALKDDKIAEAAGEEVLLRDDYSRSMDEMKAHEGKITAYHQNLQTWYEEQRGTLEKGTAALEELEKIRANPNPPKPGDPPVPPTFDAAKFLGKDEAAKLLNQAVSASAAEIAQYNAYLSNLGMTHLHTFGEPLDVLALDQQARKEGKRVDALYSELTREKREKLQADQQAKKEKDLEDRIRTKLEDEYRRRPQIPYPIGADMGDPMGNATLGGLKEQKEYGKEAALEEFYRMRQSH